MVLNSVFKIFTMIYDLYFYNKSLLGKRVRRLRFEVVEEKAGELIGCSPLNITC